MTDYCPQSFRFEVFRAADLDSGGNIDPGAGGLYISDNGIELGISPQFTTGDAQEQKKGNGRRCASYTADDEPDFYNLSLQVCSFEPELLYKLCGGALIVDGGDTVGWDRPTAATQNTNGVVLEGWSLAWDDEEQLSISGVPQYIWRAFPKTTWNVADQTVNAAFTVYQLNGKGRVNSNADVGPFGDWPQAITGPMGEWMTDSIPTASCGALTLPTY